MKNKCLLTLHKLITYSYYGFLLQLFFVAAVMVKGKGYEQTS